MGLALHLAVVGLRFDSFRACTLPPSLLPSFPPSLRPSVPPPVRPSVRPSVRLSVCLSVCLSLSLSLSLSPSLFLFLSASLLSLSASLSLLRERLFCDCPLITCLDVKWVPNLSICSSQNTYLVCVLRSPASMPSGILSV